MSSCFIDRPISHANSKHSVAMTARKAPAKKLSLTAWVPLRETETNKRLRRRLLCDSRQQRRSPDSARMRERMDWGGEPRGSCATDSRHSYAARRTNPRLKEA